MQKQLLQCNCIGRWWSKDNEIDIVALDDDTDTVWFGECTWSNKKLYILILVKISRDIVYCKDQNNCYMLFSKTGFTNDMKMIAKKDDGMLFDCNTIVQQIQ